MPSTYKSPFQKERKRLRSSSSYSKFVLNPFAAHQFVVGLFFLSLPFRCFVSYINNQTKSQHIPGLVNLTFKSFVQAEPRGSNFQGSVPMSRDGCQLRIASYPSMCSLTSFSPRYTTQSGGERIGTSRETRQTVLRRGPLPSSTTVGEYSKSRSSPTYHGGVVVADERIVDRSARDGLIFDPSQVCAQSLTSLPLVIHD
jgi:hypothetical protein